MIQGHSSHNDAAEHAHQDYVDGQKFFRQFSDHVARARAGTADFYRGFEDEWKRHQITGHLVREENGWFIEIDFPDDDRQPHIRTLPVINEEFAALSDVDTSVDTQARGNIQEIEGEEYFRIFEVVGDE